MKINFLPQLQMDYASTYGCGGNEALHICHDCAESRPVEFARTRKGGFIRKSYLATILTQPTNPTVWADGIANGNIIVLPEISGNYDPGDPKVLKGFGERKENYGPRTMKWMFNDPDYEDNYHFYNEISDRKDLVPFFVTSSLVRIFDKPASIKAKDPVVDDLEEVVIWNIECEVVSRNLPIMVKVEFLNDALTCPNA